MYKVTLIEPNQVTTRDHNGFVLGSIRPNVPLHTQPLVAASLRERTNLDLDVQIYNPTIHNAEQETQYKTTEDYGSRTLTHFMRGDSLDSSRFQEALDADIVGITANFTERANVAFAIAKEAKKINPEVKIIYGGSDAVHRKTLYLTHGNGDIIVPKDSEIVGPEVVRAILLRDSLERIAGITYREGDTLREIRGTSAQYGKNKMQDVPIPALDLVANEIPLWTMDHEGPFPEGISGPISYFEMSRGCHNSCGFCTSASIPYSFMTSEQVEERLEEFTKYGIKTLNIIDDNLLTRLLVPQGRDNLLATFSVLEEQGVRWSFGNGLQYSLFRQSDGILDEEVIQAVFSGAYCLYVPLEDPVDMRYKKLSGNPHQQLTGDISDLFKRNTEIIKAIAETGIKRMTFGFIVGYPEETKERLSRVQKTLEDLKDELFCVNPRLEILFMPQLHMPLPGTADYRAIQTNGTMNFSLDEHPELVQFALSTYNPAFVDDRLQLIENLNDKNTLEEWVNGIYPKGIVSNQKGDSA